MFEELHDGKIYLNNESMTVLMADKIQEYVSQLSNENLEMADTDMARSIDTTIVIQDFKHQWRRPRDGSSAIQDVYASVPDGIVWAAERETDRRIEALEAANDSAIYQRFIDAVLGEEDGAQ